MEQEEIWVEIKDFENYLISSLNKIKSKERVIESHHKNLAFKKELILKQFINSSGYLTVGLYDKNGVKHKLVHRLKATAFIPNPNNLPFVNHKDGNKLNIALDNLEWCTCKENTIHAFNIGLRVGRKGKANHNTILTNEQVLEIKQTVVKYGTMTRLSKKYKVHPTTIGDIINGRTWTHLNIKNKQ